MARKKQIASKAKESKPKIKWTDEESVELLAWIDHCRTHNFSSRDTVVAHLRRLSRNNYTLKQIKRRLQYYREWFKSQSPEFRKCQGRDAFIHGLSIFELKEPMLSDVSKAVARLEDELLVKRMSSGRRLRSSSRLDECLSDFTPDTTVAKFENTIFVRCQSPVNSFEAPSQSSKIKKSIEHSSTHNFKPRKRQKRENITASDIPSLDESRIKTATTSQCPSPTIDDSQSESDTIIEDNGDSIRVEPLLQGRNNPSVEPKVEIPLKDLSTMSQAQTQLRLDSAILEISDLQRKLDEQDARLLDDGKENKSLQQRVDRLESILYTRNEGGSEALEARYESMVEYVRDRNRKLQEYKRLGAFTKLPLHPDISDPKQWIGSSPMEVSFATIKHESRQVLRLHNSQRSFFTPNLAPHAELRRLVHKGLSMDPEVTAQADNLPVELRSVSPKAVIRAVITSALREWVFESNFPDLDENPSELLAKYREILGNQDGLLVLRNLDLAAYDAVIKSESFKREIVLKKGKELALQLSRTLAPFFSKCTEDDTTAVDALGFATWNHCREEYKERYERFNNMFETALLVKSYSILDSRQYSMVIFPPGTRFDKRTMSAETMEGAPLPEGENYDDRVVELCVDAAVFFFPKKTLDVKGPVSEAITHSKSFRPLDDQNVDARLLIPAVVVLRPESSDLIYKCNDGESGSNLSVLDETDIDELQWMS